MCRLIRVDFLRKHAITPNSVQRGLRSRSPSEHPPSSYDDLEWEAPPRTYPPSTFSALPKKESATPFTVYGCKVNIGFSLFWSYAEE